MRAFSRLPEPGRTVIALRYGFFDGGPMTLEQIGARLGLTSERVRQVELLALRALSELTAVLAEEHDPEKLLERSLGTMVRLARAQAGVVRVVTSDGAHMRLVAAQGLGPEVVAQEQLVPLDCGVCGAAVSDDAVRQSFEMQHCAGHTGSDFFHYLGSAVVIPLRHMGRVLGAYTLFFEEQRDTPEELGLLYRSISEHLGMALENTRLLRENMRMTLMNERQLIANEVHDSLAQSLAYMKMRMALLQDAQPGFLEEIFRGGVVADQRNQVAQQAVLVLLDEPLQQVRVALAEAARDLGAFLLHRGHEIAGLPHSC